MNEALLFMSWAALASGGFFFVSGALGLIRFPDIYCRLHAVTKADILGLGFIVLGLALRAESLSSTGVMLLIWLLVAASSALTCHLLARFEREEEAPEDEP